MTAIKKDKKKRSGRKARTKRQTVLSVVSVRISDEEKEHIDKLMQVGKFKHYSDVMRMAIQMVKFANYA